MNSFLSDVLAGLSHRSKSLPCKYLYDARGSALFDEICELEVYYPTRTELAILDNCGAALGSLLDARTRLVELGSGASSKTCVLLDRAPELNEYVPVDISTTSLLSACDRLRARYPRLSVTPVAADYTQGLALPSSDRTVSRTVLFFPGSTLGNFEPKEAALFLHGLSQLCGRDGAIVVGVDTKKDPDILRAAYNDGAGVTARFNLNLLARINGELDGDFDLQAFTHRAEYLPEIGCIEMQLISRRRQRVTIAGRVLDFERNEAIVTERSYKYTPLEFASLASSAGLRVEQQWTDRHGMFCVYLLGPGSARTTY